MQPVFHIRRTIFVSAGAVASHGCFCKFLDKVVAGTRGCAWKVERSNWPAVKAAERPGLLFVLATPGEMAGFAGHKNTFTLDAFLKRVVIVDSAAS
eukprot:9472724-Pyramimonas_sp.AAC.1